MPTFYKVMMNRRGEVLIQLCWSLCAAVLLIAVYGYQAYNGDQEEHLPYAFALSDPSLYPHDYLVPQQKEQITVRYYFAQSMAFLFRWFPEKETIFVIYLISLVLTVWPLIRLCSRRSDNPIVIPLAALAFVLFNRFSVGGNSLSDVQLTSSSLAFLFCTWSLDFFDRRNDLFAALLCALASLFQVLFGLQLMGLLLLVYLFDRREKQSQQGKAVLKMMAAYLFPAAFILIPVIYQQTGSSSQPELYNSLLFVYRNAHHYLPQCFPFSDYLKTLALWGCAGICLPHCEVIFRKRYRLFSGAVILSCLLYVIFFSFLDIGAVGKLQVFKSTVFVSYIALVPIVLAIGSRLKAIKSFEFLNKTGLPLGIGFILLLCITNSYYLPEGRWQNRYKVGNYSPGNLERMHLWIRENTPKEAVFISFASDASFLCEARRSLVVAYKGIIHTPEFMLPWYQKMLAVYRAPVVENVCQQNVMSRADSAYALLPDSNIIAGYPFAFRLWKTEPLPGSGPEIHREGDYILTRSVH